MDDRFGSLALLTDLYQLTMAYGYWKKGKQDQQAAFHLFFRSPPFHGGYAVMAGLEPALQYIERFHFDEGDIEYLRSLTGNDGGPLFEEAFLLYLSQLRMEVDVAAMQEGTLVFAHEPMMRICGSILQCQILETALLNTLNFQTLIATKAARIVRAAQGDQVLEFGLRRAQGVDGALAASRAAYIGGCHATSNVLAGKLFGIPVRGTHAHSWIMSFDTELEAFQAYADAMPNNCVFLVDTYDTLEGVRHAILVGLELKANGHKMIGIRLDSGDLAFLSIEARKLLDAAGLNDTIIVASNDLDERLIQSLKQQGAKIAVWGVGTKLVTAYDQPALGGVYKLGAIQDETGDWIPKIKLSEQSIKTSNPGLLQVRRFRKEGRACGDLLYNELSALPSSPTMVSPSDPFTPHMQMEGDFEDLLTPILHKGKRINGSESIIASRQRVSEQIQSFPESLFRFDNPQPYPVGLESSLYELKQRLFEQGRSK